jgi:hypothetical protein
MPIPQVATEALRDGMMRFDSGSREGETVAIRLLARRKSTFTRIVAAPARETIPKTILANN